MCGAHVYVIPISECDIGYGRKVYACYARSMKLFKHLPKSMSHISNRIEAIAHTMILYVYKAYIEQWPYMRAQHHQSSSHAKEKTAAERKAVA